MKIFNWMQSKFSNKPAEVKKQTSKSSSQSHHNNQILHDQRNEEFSDWPHGLLAIGTFGNNNLQEKPQECDTTENNLSSSDENHLDFTPEEVGKLQKELTKLLSRKPKDPLSEDGSSLPLDKFLNCPSSLEVDRTNCTTFCEDEKDVHDDDDMSSSVVLSGGKDVCMGKNKSIRRKSITFLLKKMFVCRSGFGPAPSLSDPITESRMEKLLRTLLHKKILPQNTTTASLKKFLSDKHISLKNKEDDADEKHDSGAKWVKTDSEFIVLEI